MSVLTASPGLERLNIGSNCIKRLENLPGKLKELWIESNDIMYIENTPDSLDMVEFTGNNLCDYTSPFTGEVISADSIYEGEWKKIRREQRALNTLLKAKMRFLRSYHAPIKTYGRYAKSVESIHSEV
jgi:hypothetical protein